MGGISTEERSRGEASVKFSVFAIAKSEQGLGVTSGQKTCSRNLGIMEPGDLGKKLQNRGAAVMSQQLLFTSENEEVHVPFLISCHLRGGQGAHPPDTSDFAPV